LFSQLMGESLLLTLAAFIIALAVVTTALPAFNTLTGKTMSALALLQPESLSVIVVIFIMISLFAGAYPAMKMSSSSPARVLKNFIGKGKEANALRKSLVVFQFTMSIILIAGTILIFRQMEFMQNQNLGFEKEQTIHLSMRSSISDKYKLIKDEISKVPGVRATSATSFSFTGGIGNIATLPEGANDNEITSEATISIDHDFIPAFKIEMLAGRNFSKDIPTDDTAAFIVNESAVRHFNWGTPETALGKKINWGLGKKGNVIGVVKDFNYSSLHDAIKPLIIHIQPGWYGNIAVKVNGNNIPETISKIEAKWKELNLDSPFEYTFMDDDFQALYKAEQQTKTIIGWFTSLAIFIACLGLFGLAAFMAEQRTKEIGVRKVLGADIFGIVTLLSKDFLTLVVIAIVFAVPISWYGASLWLESFAYKTAISWWIFALAGGSAIFIALVTVSFQSIKAAIANPVNSLRSE
jgi:putative ABC transport system permease protein